MADAHTNFAYSTVATAPSPPNSGTSLTVSSGSGSIFPTPPFNATVWPSGQQPTTTNAEIVRVTNISGDTFTIIRQQEGTSARSITSGDQIAATITARTLVEAEGDLIQWEPYPHGSLGAVTFGANTHFIFPIYVPANMRATQVNFFISASISTSSNSSHGGTLSMNFGLYTRSESSLSQLLSNSQSFAWTNTSNNSTSLLSGIKVFSIPLNVNLTPGNYWGVLLSRTSTVNANWITISNLIQSASNVALSGIFGSSVHATYQRIPGMGAFSASSTELRNSYAFSDVRSGSATNYWRVPYLQFVNFTF
ncbi:MAG: hypothetical protein N2558_04145 [Patescibacteria group bacterium]|nr:hypothetical protein [Patescibacteria group bacterium]